MQPLRRLLPLAFMLVSATASSEPSRFDGQWRGTLTCPPHSAADDDAKGYQHQLAGEIVNGELTMTHGKEGEPGWHLLKGKVQSNGDADLRLSGIVNNPKYAINDAPRGKPYSYRVRAQFEERVGEGQRLTGRACELRFAK
jgi:hypothetical protein